MTLNHEMADALNVQICGEYESYFIYCTMANWFAEHNLQGFEKLFISYANEELVHASRLTKFVTSNNGHVTSPKGLNVDSIEEDEHSSISTIFSKALDHEIKVSESYINLKKLALSLFDYTTANELDWFINEQVEEEEKMRTLLAEFDIGTSNNIVTFMNESFKK